MPALDDYSTFASGVTSPAIRAVAITPDDDNDLTYATRAIYIGGDGDLAVVMQGDDTAVTFSGLVAGTILPIRVARVLDTNTSASAILGLR